MKRLVVVLVAGVSLLSAPSVEQKVSGLLREADNGAELWGVEKKLRELGEEAVPFLKEGLDDESPLHRVLCAGALRAMEPKLAGQTLLKLLDSEDDSIAVTSARFLAGVEDDQIEYEVIKKVRAPETDDRLRVELAKSLWWMATSDQSQFIAVGVLGSLVERKDREIAIESALALGEVDQLNEKAIEILRGISSSGSLKGRLAKAILEKLHYRRRYLDDLRRDETLRTALINEIEALIRRYHIEEPPPPDVLTNFAARGVVSSLAYIRNDRFSAYLDPQQFKRMKESLSLTYGGIGAIVQVLEHNSEKFFSIIEPIYGGPADKAGLRRYDRIIAIEGEPTKGKRVDQLASRLRGPENSRVTITVWRPSWKKPKEIAIIRQRITLPTVHTDILPGKIGYIRADSFSERAEEEIKEALDRLDKQKVLGLLFDLRFNPGGLLQAAHRVSDLFLSGGKIIVYTKGRNPKIAPRKDYLSTDRNPHTNLPMVVLVNNHSASASEIVAGALKFYKRAVLVGQKTFGKGSVQQFMPLRSLGGKAALKLTIAKYYLPTGDSIHGRGIQPDVYCTPSTFPYSLFSRLRSKGKFDRFSHEYVEKKLELYKKLVRYDALDPSRYPEFEEWFKTLRLDITRQQGRKVLRYWLRGIVSDFLKRDLTGSPLFQEKSEGSSKAYLGDSPDFVEDAELLRGIIELSRLSKQLKDTFPIEYRTIIHKSRNEELEEAYEKLFGTN